MCNDGGERRTGEERRGKGGEESREERGPRPEPWDTLILGGWGGKDFVHLCSYFVFFCLPLECKSSEGRDLFHLWLSTNL